MAISFKPAALALDMGTIKVNHQAACSPNSPVTTFWWLTLPCPPLSHCLLFCCHVLLPNPIPLLQDHVPVQVDPAGHPNLWLGSKHAAFDKQGLQKRYQ